MKNINLISITEVLENLEGNILKNYLKYFGIDEIKENEKKDLIIFTNLLQKYFIYSIFFEGYFFGFKIPQIGKEFDLLRFGKNFNLNIEFKSQNVGEEKIRKQLIRNKYYLEFLEKEYFYFTFVSEGQKLYNLTNEDNLEEVNFEILVDLIKKQELLNIENIDNLFNPSNYLISPFNSTDRFINGEYFLTRQQEEIKKQILKKIKEEKEFFLGVTGSAGTGKTLLTYDIAKFFINDGKNVLIVHSGILNNGHNKLKEKYGWKIIGIKNFYSILLDNMINKYDFVVIDEAQRPPESLFKLIIEKSKGIKYILSYDIKQFLNSGEDDKNFLEMIGEKNIFKLKDKIRSNKEIGDFILMFFDNKKNNLNKNYSFKNININYFSSISSAKNYAIGLKSDYEILNFTPKFRGEYSYEKFNLNSRDLNSHKVIGQEFDNVLVVITPNFFYNDNGKLAYDENLNYVPTKMLFQNMTRAIKKLNIVIIDNKEILNRCLEILN